jgi:type IV secretory pathway VirB6-like protein
MVIVVVVVVVVVIWFGLYDTLIDFNDSGKTFNYEGWISRVPTEVKNTGYPDADKYLNNIFACFFSLIYSSLLVMDYLINLKLLMD